MRLEPPIPPEVLAAARAPLQALATPALGGLVLDAAVVQPLELFLDLVGEALRERLFIVQSPGGEEACLRPDFTIAAGRAHVASGRAAGRYFYEGHAFRVAPAGADRAEEFLQIGIEAFEADGAQAAAATRDAEMAAAAWRAASAGGRDDLTLLFGDVGLFSAFIDALGLADPLATRLKRAFSSPRRLRAELADTATGAATEPRPGDRLAHLLGGLSEAEGAAVLAEIWALAGIQPVGGRAPAEIVHRLAERAALARAPRLTPAQADLIRRFLTIAAHPARAVAEVAALAGDGGGALGAVAAAWERRLADLDAQGAPTDRLVLSTAFGRAFGYYDGVFFEVRSAALGEAAPVAAGGRYDGLPARLGGAPGGGAVGCVVRPGRAWLGGRA